jgi:hypothetical protein
MLRGIAMNEALIKSYFSRLKLTAILTTSLFVSGLIVGIYAGHEMVGNILLWGSMISFLFYLGVLQDVARNLGRKHVRWLVLTLIFLPLSFPVSYILISGAVREFVKSRPSIVV